MKKILLLLLFILNITIFSYDTRIEINKTMINNLLESIGEVNGSSYMKIFNQKIKYKWTIQSSNIEISEGTAIINSEVLVDTGIEKTKSRLLAELEVNYDYEKEELVLNVVKSEILEIEGFNGNAKIKNVDISKFYKPSYSLKINKPKEEIVEIKINENDIRKIKISPVKAYVKFVVDKIVLEFDLDYIRME